MSDLDKLVKGENIYRHEDKRAIADKWETLASIFQFGSLGGLFVMIFILEAIPKEAAKVVVWYLAGVIFITATIGFFLGRKAIKHQMIYLKARHNQVSGIIDEAIERNKNGINTN